MSRTPSRGHEPSCAAFYALQGRPRPTYAAVDVVVHAQRAAFDAALVSSLPALRAQAHALARDGTLAEDLLHDAALNALAAWESFLPGTSFVAWMRRILRNCFLSCLRRQRWEVALDERAAERIGVAGTQQDKVALREVEGTLQRMAPRLREAFCAVVLDGMSYDALAARTGKPVNTLKSRVHCARRHLNDGMRDPADAPRRRADRETRHARPPEAARTAA